MSDCVHVDFMAQVDVHRLFVDEHAEPTASTTMPDSFTADVSIVCAQCGERFVFIGTPTGMSPRQPMASVDGTELRAPVRPLSMPPGWGESGPGFVTTFEPKPGRHEN